MGTPSWSEAKAPKRKAKAKGKAKARTKGDFDDIVPGAKARYMAHKEYDEDTGLLKEWKRFFMGADDKVGNELVKFAPGETDEKFDCSTLPDGWNVATPYQVPPRPPYESEEYD